MTDVAGGLITLEYALEGLHYPPKEYRDGEPLDARDADVAAYIRAATPLIEHLVGGKVRETTATKRFNGGKPGILLSDRLDSSDAVSSVTEDGSVITDYVVDEDARIIYAGTSNSPRRFAAGRKNITVTLTTGWSEVPAALRLATRLLVVHMIEQKNVAVPQFDGVNVETSGPPMGFLIPNRVAELCAPYRIAGGIA